MKDTRVFKIRRQDGRFATRNDGYGGIHWGEVGTIWKGVGPLKQSLKSSLKEVDWSVCEIVVYELKEVSCMDKKDFEEFE